MRDVIIIGCSGKKRTGKMKARDLYNGPFWTTLRKNDDGRFRIFVLSAKYGLIPADTIISPYDSLLGRDVSVSELAKKIKKQRKKYRLKNARLVAGKKYAEAMEEAGIKFTFVEGDLFKKRSFLKSLLIKGE